jgi:hypothetical protein
VALRAAMEQFGSAPQAGSPWIVDDEAVAYRASQVAQGRAKVLRYARQQASLIYVNAWDHLITLARVLGGDGAMPLFSQATVSRVVCEAAVRFAWLMDPDISSAERLVRGAAALQYSADERSKGVRALPADRFDPRVYQKMLDSCSQEQDSIRKLIHGAGMAFGFSRKGSEKVRVELQSSKVAAPLKINITELMAEWLPDSPSWYNVGSSVAHSTYWGAARRQPLPSRRVPSPDPERAGRWRCRRVRDLRLGADSRSLRKDERLRSHSPCAARTEAPRGSRCPYEARRHLRLDPHSDRAAESRI